MSILQKAIQHDKQRSSNEAADRAADSHSISGCYGIDNLFVDKSKKLSFAEFWSGLKDIFLGCLIFIPKALSAIFSIIKRPGYALGIFCMLVLFLVIMFIRSTPRQIPNITAVRNAKFVPIAANEPAEPVAPVVVPVAKVEIQPEPVVEVSPAVQNRTQGLHFSRSFESKVSSFFSQHRVSDIMCKDGHCLLKIDNDVFCEHSTLCDYPKIVMELPTEDELIFSDGAGNYCAIKIDALFQ